MLQTCGRSKQQVSGRDHVRFICACHILPSATSTCLKANLDDLVDFAVQVRWLIGTMVMGVPVLLVHFWSYWERGSMRDLDGAILPSDAPIHITVSWAVGALMSFLADTYRRQMFVNHKLAATAAEKELRETQVRL